MIIFWIILALLALCVIGAIGETIAGREGKYYTCGKCGWEYEASERHYH